MSISVFLSAALIGCGGGTEQLPPSTAWGSVPAIVHDGDQPTVLPWEFEIRLEIGADSEADEYLLRSPIALTVLPGGTIVIGDDRPMQLRAYDVRGSHVASFGQPGGGPGDLAPAPFGWVMRPTGERTFELWSGWPPRVQEWTAAGELLSVETVAGDHPIIAGPAPRTLGFLDDRLYWYSASFGSDEENRTVATSHLLVGDREGANVDTMTSISHEPMPVEYQAVLQFGFGHAALLKDQVLISRTNRWYLASRLEDWIVELDLERREPLVRFRLAHEPDVIPADTRERPGVAFGGQDTELFADGLDWLRERVSLLGLGEGPDGQILVQRSGDPIDDAWPTDVFSAGGEYLGRTMLPVEPRTIIVMERDLYGFGTSGGVPVVRRFRINQRR